MAPLGGKKEGGASPDNAGRAPQIEIQPLSRPFAGIGVIENKKG